MGYIMEVRRVVLVFALLFVIVGAARDEGALASSNFWHEARQMVSGITLKEKSLERVSEPQLLHIVEKAKSLLKNDEAPNFLMNNEAFLSILPEILQDTISSETNAELSKAVSDTLQEYALESGKDPKSGLTEMLIMLNSREDLGLDIKDFQSTDKEGINWIKVLIWLKLHWDEIKDALEKLERAIIDKLIELLEKYVMDHWDEILQKLLEQLEKFIKDHWDEISPKLLELLEGLISDNWDVILAKLLEISESGLQNILSKYYLPIGDSISHRCSAVTSEFFDHIADDDSHILQMVDSWGKLPDGFLFGNFMTLGMYEECIQSETSYLRENSTQVKYKGRYCKVTYRKVARELDFSGKLALAHGLFGYGTCIPSVCSAADLEVSLNKTLNGIGLEIGSIHCRAKDQDSTQLSTLDKSIVCLISIFLIFVVLGTIFDVSTRNMKNTKFREGPWKVVIGFSFWKNLEYIFTYKEELGSDSISCLPALRVITMTWIVICRQYQIDMFFIENFMDSLKYQDPVPTQIVTNGWFAGDTFLCLTGIVIAYRVFPAVELTKGVGVAIVFIKTFVRRFFRLAPSILFVALFSASVLRYLGDGPVAYTLDDFVEECRDYWWKDPLFINNYIFGENEGFQFKDCLDHCWYTAVDMQLLLVLPVLLIPFAINKIIGGIIFAVVFICSIIIPMVITVVNDLPPSPIHLMTPEEHFEYNWRVYVVPWCRAGPWLAGILTGVLLQSRRVKHAKIHKLIVFCGYIMAITLGLLLVMVLYPFNHVEPDEDFRDFPAMSASYGSLARPVWGICVAFVVFCCHTRNSEVVNRILSYPGWRPLAKLTFGIYLVSPVVQKWWLAYRKDVDYFNYEEKLFQSLGILFISGLVSIGLTCFVERPICTILNFILPSAASQKDDGLAPFTKEQVHVNNNHLQPVTLGPMDYTLPRIPVSNGVPHPTLPLQEYPQPFSNIYHYPQAPYERSHPALCRC